MAEPDWSQGEELLFERCLAALKRFGREHPDEAVSLFAYTVDTVFSGVGLNFDTPTSSLTEAKEHQRYEIEHRNHIFASDTGWKDAANSVSEPCRQIDDFNRRGAWRYEQFEFVPVPAWEDFFNGMCGSDDDEGSDLQGRELEGRVIATLWRVTDRLVRAQAFDGLRRVPPFRIVFGFHDDEIVVLRILDWPGADGERT